MCVYVSVYFCKSITLHTVECVFMSYTFLLPPIGSGVFRIRDSIASMDQSVEDVRLPHLLSFLCTVHIRNSSHFKDKNNMISSEAKYE